MQRLPDGSPGPFRWLLAVISLVLPWAGAALIAYSAWLAYFPQGRWVLPAISGVALIILDVVIDFAWVRRDAARSDQPELNSKASQLIGRVAVLVEPIEDGLGKARCDDTLWNVEGPALPAGSLVRIVGANGMRLQVTASEASDAPQR